MPWMPLARSSLLHDATLAFTSWPNAPLAAAAVPAAAPAVSTVARAATATFLLSRVVRAAVRSAIQVSPVLPFAHQTCAYLTRRHQLDIGSQGCLQRPLVMVLPPQPNTPTKETCRVEWERNEIPQLLRRVR